MLPEIAVGTEIPAHYLKLGLLVETRFVSSLIGLVSSNEFGASVSLGAYKDTDMSAFNVVATCVKCSHPNPVGSISELRFKQGQFRMPDRAHEFTCVSCGEKSIVKEHEVQLICRVKPGDKKLEN